MVRTDRDPAHVVSQVLLKAISTAFHDTRRLSWSALDTKINEPENVQTHCNTIVSHLCLFVSRYNAASSRSEVRPADVEPVASSCRSD